MKQRLSVKEEAVDFLVKKDKYLASIIDQIGVLSYTINQNVFESIVRNIIAQQVSNKAAKTVWERLNAQVGDISPDTLGALSTEELQSIGITFKKAGYIRHLVEEVEKGTLNLNALEQMGDEDVIQSLTRLKGVGLWTAEMLLIFSLNRPNVLSYGDLAIQRGLRMVYHHRKITPQLHNKYWRRYSPYATTASLYLWEVSSGRIDGMKDYAPKKRG